ncbi:hypothetical protein CMU09_18235 [Elizabethkingia anophelis]|uniref:hypothetical protein n=1 Tax=Elizabethkingia anophelis TaxID=1117645 RepID=UPI0020113740|nr:hypothetical protein [Elizabethkingia anophelis]EJC8061928.1 hypothetical protein [Elizabethkingia anophelis]MCL1640018.1 hypothetical protein [Elizabethkingia anophelis]MCT3926889.1 hypothetical protein [Elizabethkingia anophelis]MCT4035572.1 hypothetical protein [Elizabethkingia anophelis]MCT4101725.1 hypothetical protein [Elizabethkingia anophelis]
MGDLVVNKKNGIIELFNTAPFCTVTKAELSRGILSDDYIDMTVESSEKLDLNLEDRIIVEGRSYFVNLLPQVKKNAEDSFTHEIRFFGASSILRRNILFNRDSQGGKTGFEFPMTAELNAFLYLIINNANEFESNWILGDFPTNTTTKTISFQKENCLAALQRVCQEFNVEFEVEETGGKFVLHIREKIGKLLPFKVEYGMGNGLYDLTRARSNDSEVVTILYGYGSSENIPVKYRGYSPRLRMPIAIGDYITNQAAQELFGKVVGVFDPDIKPEFKGIVSGVGSLTNGLQEISVSNMDFDLKEKESDGKTTKYLIAGTPAKISVTKGNLAGYDFEINDYDHSSKTFKLKQFADDRGQNFPDSTTVFKFATGDEFTLIDIIMPEQYIINAEQKLYDETVKEYQKVSQNNVKYTLNVDPLFLQDKGEIGIGDLLPIKDADFGIDKASRIISLKKDLLTDTYTSFDVADSYEISLVKEIVNNIKDLQKEIASQKVINRQSYLDGYRRVEDRFSMYFDADGKMDGSHIKADTIDVGMLSSGSKSRWFQLEEVVFTPNLGSDPNSFRATAGRLVHFGIKTSSGAERVWNLSALTVNNLLNQGYYVYAKCDINGDYGTFVITPDRIVFDSQPNYYHFLIGNLYTAASGGRAFDANYGVSQMNGRMIFAGVISDIQGRPMIDLDKREIIGKVTFTNDSPALNQVQEKIDAVRVGGRNYLLNSSEVKTTNRFTSVRTDYLKNLVGKQVIFSFDIKTNNGGILRDINVYGYQQSGITISDSRTFKNSEFEKWERFSLITTIVDLPVPPNYSIGDIGFYDQIGNNNYSIRNVKIEEGNKATDWTPAPEDLNEEITIAKQNAANAQNTANTAAQNANDANKKLSDIANDNIVTPQEKPVVLQEYYDAANERQTIIDQAKAYNVDYATYNNTFIALDGYLVSVNMFGDMYSNTSVDGVVFKQSFRTYYSERSKLYKLISDAAKSYAATLVDNIKIGGVNLMDYSENPLKQNPDYYHVDGVIADGNFSEGGFFQQNTRDNGYSYIDLDYAVNKMQVGKEYTISFEAWVGQNLRVGIGWTNMLIFSSLEGIPTGDKEWKRFSKTLKLNTPDYKVLLVMINEISGTANAFRRFKIEEGNKATPWTASQADIDRQLKKAQDDANIANQKLADIASDNKLTPEEKPTTMQEWAIIYNERPDTIANAAIYGVSAVAYDGKVNELAVYLNNIGYSDLSYTSNINGTEFRQKFVDVYTAKADLIKRISDTAKNYTNSTTEAAKLEMAKDARNKALAASYASGNCLNRDVDFRNGLNGIQVYNNAGNGTVSLVHWIGGAPASQAPTKSTNVLAVEYNGQGASPYNGGFYFGTQTRANAVFVVRIIMKLATGQDITFHSNAAGDNYKFDWVTPATGTGKWEEYIGILRCGATGAFSSSMFFAFFGASVPLSTYICYASVFDLTDVDKYLEDRIKQNEQQTAIAKAQADNALSTANRVSQLTSFMNTTVDGNVVASGTMLVGDVNGGNAGMTGVTDRGSDSVRFFLGTNYANKNKAPLAFIDKGLIQMHHPNGVLGFEMGIVNGKLVFNVYDNAGNKTMEMGSQGIIFSNYIPDSWDNYSLLNIPAGSTNTDADFENFLRGQLMINTYQNDTYGWCNVDLNTNNNYWRYSAGVSYDSANYKQYEKFYYDTDNSKQKPGPSTPKKWDGWYAMPAHAQGSDAPVGGMSNWSITILCIRLAGGEQVQTKNISMSGSEFIHP